MRPCGDAVRGINVAIVLHQSQSRRILRYGRDRPSALAVVPSYIELISGRRRRPFDVLRSQNAFISMALEEELAACKLASGINRDPRDLRTRKAHRGNSRTISERLKRYRQCRQRDMAVQRFAYLQRRDINIWTIQHDANNREDNHRTSILRNSASEHLPTWIAISQVVCGGQDKSIISDAEASAPSVLELNQRGIRRVDYTANSQDGNYRFTDYSYRLT